MTKPEKTEKTEKTGESPVDVEADTGNTIHEHPFREVSSYEQAYREKYGKPLITVEGFLDPERKLLPVLTSVEGYSSNQDIMVVAAMMSANILKTVCEVERKAGSTRSEDQLLSGLLGLVMAMFHKGPSHTEGSAAPVNLNNLKNPNSKDHNGKLR